MQDRLRRLGLENEVLASDKATLQDENRSLKDKLVNLRNSLDNLKQQQPVYSRDLDVGSELADMRDKSAAIFK